MVQARVRLLLCVMVAAIATSCGAPGVPLPPSLQLPAPVTDLRAVRKGDKVYLSWTVPARNTDKLKVRELGQTQICRSVGRPVVAGDCAVPAGVVAPPEAVSSESKLQPEKAKAGFVDELSPAELSGSAGSQVFYAIAVLNDRGRNAGLSNQVQVASVPVLPAPSGLTAIPSSEGVVLNWSAVSQAASDSTLKHAYRAYRREAGGTQDAVAGELPADATEARLVDHTFEWEKPYEYRVTIVTEVIENGKLQNQVEGEDSAPVRVFVHDIFPPAVPSSLQAVYSNDGQHSFIDLIWSPDSEADLAGYNVYRREADKDGEWTKINSQPVAAPAYRDVTVAAGARYWYAVTAVDVRQNESAKSEAAAEQTP